MMTVKNTSSASAAVTTIWLVTVKECGMHADEVADQDEHEQAEHEREKLIPCSPAAERTMPATNS